jgi:hypothetical protein
LCQRGIRTIDHPRTKRAAAPKKISDPTPRADAPIFVTKNIPATANMPEIGRFK